MCTLLDFVKTGEVGFNVREQDPAKVGEMRASALHLKELNTEPFLKPGDGVADSGLGTIELLGRSSKASQVDNGLQDFPFIEGGTHAPNISSKSMHLSEKCDYRFEILSRYDAFGRFSSTGFCVNHPGSRQNRTSSGVTINGACANGSFVKARAFAPGRTRATSRPPCRM
jgi:hypothetical protein